MRIKNLVLPTEREVEFFKNKKLGKLIIFTNIISILLLLCKKEESAIKFAVFSIKIAAVLRIIYFIFLLITIIISNL
ncbi:MAG: hypothetical protein QXT86_11285 [Archaeoglobaceae archaeon]